jgi:hypothetical protein
MKGPRLGRILPLVFLLFSTGLCFGENTELARAYPLIYFGRVLLADATSLELRHVGLLSPVAPMVAEDAAGRIWGRLEPRHLAALDPAHDEMVARARLPHKPGVFLITTAGKAYITHGSPRQERFSISVLDTRREVLLEELKGMVGLPLELAEAAGFVYVVALSVLKSDPMEARLYQISEETGLVQEVLASADTGYSWKLAASGGLLYLGYLPAEDNPGNGRVEVRDARTFRLLRSWDAPPGPLRALYARDSQVMLFCQAAGGKTDLLIQDSLLSTAAKVQVLEGPVARVLGVHGARMVYLDRLFETGKTDVSVHFYDLAAGRELKRINIRDYLLAEDPNRVLQLRRPSTK